MRCLAAILLAVALVTTGLLRGQEREPVPVTTKAYHEVRKRLLTALAERMPEEYYNFKPTPEMQTFGDLVAHVTQHQERFCSEAMGQQYEVSGTGNQAASPRRPGGTVALPKSKTELVAALEHSFAACEAAMDAVTEANATELIDGFGTRMSRLRILLGDLLHSSEEYGYLAVYLRLKGVVPPSSDPEFLKTLRPILSGR